MLCIAVLIGLSTVATGQEPRERLLTGLEAPAENDAQAGAQKTSGESGERKVIFQTDFENHAGLGGEGVKFHGNWRPLDKEMTAAMEAPQGEGNSSKLVLTVRTPKAGHTCCMELPSHGMEVEKYGWDGGIKLKLYNNGFESFQMTYSPIYPSDVTFYRARFDAPQGKWVELDVPLDKFLYQGRRPRRNCALEYICLIGINPASETATFQFDDFQVYRQKRPDLPPPRPMPNPGDAIYRQDFDDPFDFDMESYYPVSRRCNVYWTPGGVDAKGQALADAKDDSHGCLKLEMASSGEGRGGRRGFSLSATNAVVEFDCLSHGFTGLVLGARSKAQLRAPIPGKPADDQWKHYAVPCWKLQEGNGAAADPADKIWEITVGGEHGDAGSYLLMDNIVVRQPTAGDRQ